TPNTVFSGTAISAISIVSQNAWIAAGVVIESQNWPKPCSHVRYKTRHTGNASSAPRYPSATSRSPIRVRRSTLMSRPPRAQAPDPDQDDHGEQQQDDRHRSGARRVVGLDLPEDEDGRDLRLERDVPADQHDRAELPD